MNKLRRLKKGLAILLTATMVVGLMPGTGTLQVSAAGGTSTGDGVQTTLDVSKGSITIADDSVSGCDGEGNAVTTTDPDGYIITGTTTSNMVTVSGTQNITFNGVNIDVSQQGYTDCAFKIEDNNTGDVNITLADGSENTLISGKGCAGLQKNGEYNETLGMLTIQGSTNGTGKLTASGGFHGAGIGGGNNGVASNITINGGIITANGGRNGAGIGGGNEGVGSNITINGGTVTTKTENAGAGIGGGYNGVGSNITINDGTVKANGWNGAGIGGGIFGDGLGIDINGGTVTAESYDGAGIGGGYNYNRSDGKGKGTNITISGGTVTASSSRNGAGIGGGDNAEGSDIVITGGSVKASSTKANAIGGGFNKDAVTPTDGTNTVYLLTISNSDSVVVYIDGEKYPTHDDGYVYAYLAGSRKHIVEVGTSTKEYTYDTGTSSWSAEEREGFSLVAASPVYNGQEQNLIIVDFVNRAYTISYSSEENGTYETNIPTGKAAGTYYVWYKVTDSSGNLVAHNSVEVELARKPITVTANNASKTYGGADPEISYKVDAGTPLVGEDALTGTLSRKTGEEVGTYAITQGTLTNENNTNYDISFTGGTFTINRVKVTPPGADDTTFTYTGSEQTYGIADSEYYTVTGNKQTDAGTYTVTVALKDKRNSGWSDGTTTDKEYTFKINKKKAEVSAPTASTAITYGKTLADTGLSDGWTWDDGAAVPSVNGSTEYTAYKDVNTDEHNYDYSGLSGFGYDEENHKLSCKVLITVNQVTPDVAVTATPASTIAGKTITVTVTAKNPNNDALTDVPAVTLTYKIGDDEETAFTDSFEIPKDTAVGTIVTIKAATVASDNYVAGTDTTTVTVIACTHEKVQNDAWSTDGTYHWHVCPDCGEVVDKADHTWDTGTVTKEATPIEKGVKTYTCTVCKETKTEEVSALGAPEVRAEETSDDGKATYKVTASGLTKGTVTYVAPTNKNATTVSVPATVTIDGITYKVTAVADNAFANNKKLTKVTIGSNVTSVGKKAFYKCTKLKTVKIGSNVTTINASAFYGCSKLTSVTMGSKVTTISEKAFYKCTSLTKITIPSKVKKIGKQAFYGCKKLKSIAIKTTKLTSSKVGSKAFKGIYAKATIKVPKNKLTSYKKILKAKGVGAKAKIKK